jgi:hypothetical protein
VNESQTVYIEPGLGPVKEYLSQHGCAVKEANNGQALSENACCMVVTGADNNLMGMQDVVVDIPIVNADGLTPEQVYQRVQRYLS